MDNVVIGDTLGNMGFGRGPVSVPRNVHRYIVGATGSGKTTLLKRLILGDVLAGDGALVIDPHGTEGRDSLVGDIAGRVPPERVKDVIWFDPLSEKPLGLNPLSAGTKLAVDEFIEIASRIYGEGSFQGRSAWIARNYGYAVQEAFERFTPWHFHLMFMRKDFRQFVFSRVKDSNVRMFCEKFEEELPERTRLEAEVAPMNKSDALVGNYLLRHVFGQEKGLDLRRAMDDGRIVLCRLSKGQMGEETTALLGSALMNGILHAAMKRNPGSKPFHVYVDEASTLTKGNRIDRILAELRKYGVFITLIYQMLDAETKHHIFANVGTQIVGRSEYSEELGRQMQVDPEVIQNLRTGEWLVKEGGGGTKLVFSKPPEGKSNPQTRKKAIKRSFIRYGKWRDEVEKQLNRISEVGYAGTKRKLRQGKAAPRPIPGSQAGGDRRPPEAAARD